MTNIDMTTQLVPILWAMEVFLAVGVAWLFVSYLWHEWRGDREFAPRAPVLRALPPKTKVVMTDVVHRDNLAA